MQFSRKCLSMIRHTALRLAAYVAEQRRLKWLTQAQVAKRLGRHQPFVAHIESGQRRVDIVELLRLAAVIGFDPRDLIDELLTIAELGLGGARRSRRRR